MPTYCISDLHLCDKGPRDNFCFNGREARFHKFLDHVETCNGRLIVLGDLFDWWQANLSDSVLAHLPLIDRLATMNAIYVVGNHDCALLDFDSYVPLFVSFVDIPVGFTNLLKCVAFVRRLALAFPSSISFLRKTRFSFCSVATPPITFLLLVSEVQRPRTIDVLSCEQLEDRFLYDLVILHNLKRGFYVK